MKEFYRKYLHNGLCLCIMLALGINLLIEMLARQSPLAGIGFAFEHPLVFGFNSLLIFASFSIALLTKRRVFMYIVISMFWLGLGITNGIILGHRMTPFTVSDLKELADGLSLATNYFTRTELTLIITAVVLLAAVLIILFIKAPKKKEKIDYRKHIAAVMIIVAGTFGISWLAVKVDLVDTYFPNLAYGFRDNGFTYSFIVTAFDTGISRPGDYSAEAVRDIFTKRELKTKVGGNTLDGSESHPNIVFLQLESFFDPMILNDVKFSKDPIPNFRKLMEENTSGKVEVPSLGAGTANTEFEAMTGMRTKFFGPGEYPYKTVMKDEVCESIPYNLKDIGYSTHAIHNHRGVFYGRNEVFKHLGFDTFTSLEYMNGVTNTPKNWARDDVLTKQIEDALESTPNEDYIYTISVQGHGSYPTEQLIMDPEITVEEAPTEELKWQWEYYVNQLYEMDQFIKDLTEMLEGYDEDVVFIAYGDHLPAIESLSADEIEGQNEYQTDYLVWSNYDLDTGDMDGNDYYMYQLGAMVLEQLDIHVGTITTYHQNHMSHSDYMSGLHMLEYDILYGDKFIYGDDGTTPYKATDMRMGVKEIKVDEVVRIGDQLYIKGQNFTEYSKINLDGEILDTTYIGPTILALEEEVDPAEAKNMKVSQVEKNKEILSTTE